MAAGIAWEQRSFGRIVAQDGRGVYSVHIYRTAAIPGRPWIVELMKHGSRHLSVPPSYCASKSNAKRAAERHYADLLSWRAITKETRGEQGDGLLLSAQPVRGRG